MTPTAVLLLLVAAFAHAGWNLMGKSRRPSAGFFLVACLAGAVCLSPILILHGGLLPHIPARVWLLLAATGVFQAIYFTGLAWAYRLGHISVAYPLARAVPVVLVALINLLIGRGHQIGPAALVGMLVMAAGCLLLPMARFTDLRWANYLHASSAMALVAAVGSCGYSIIDSEALAILNRHPPTAVGKAPVATLYLMLEMLCTATVLGLYVLAVAPERTAASALGRRGILHAAGAGAIIVLAYGLTLVAMGFVANVSYVVAFRQISIPIGAALGITLLREPAPAPKRAGLAVLLTGLLLVALG